MIGVVSILAQTTSHVVHQQYVLFETINHPVNVLQVLKEILTGNVEKVRSVLSENFKKDSDYVLFQDVQKQLLPEGARATFEPTNTVRLGHCRLPRATLGGARAPRYDRHA